MAAMRNLLPSNSDRLPNRAPQMRTAFASMASNTGSNSPGDELMTLQHFRRRGLLLQGFGEIVGALVQFVEQPRVLDGDDRLGGEIPHQFDLLVGERSHFLTEDDDSADQHIVFKHGNGKMRLCTSKPGRNARHLLSRVVGAVDHPSCFQKLIQRSIG